MAGVGQGMLESKSEQLKRCRDSEMIVEGEIVVVVSYFTRPLGHMPRLERNVSTFKPLDWSFQGTWFDVFDASPAKISAQDSFAHCGCYVLQLLSS